MTENNIINQIELNAREAVTPMATTMDYLNQPLWERETVAEVFDALTKNDKHIGTGAKCENETLRDDMAKQKESYRTVFQAQAKGIG